ncbi:MAG: hypothetical protein WC975_03515 [Phycisphaerae bacterium]
MKRNLILLSVGALAMIVMSGCGGGGGTEFTSNALAKASLAGTSWADSGQNVVIAFDDQAQVTEFDAPGLPPELANMNLDGTPFTFTIPQDGLPSQLAGYAGDHTATLVNTSTILNDDGTFELVFTGTVDIGIIQDFTFTITGTVVGEDVGSATLTDLNGSLVVNIDLLVTVLPIELFNEPLGQDLDVIRTE